MKTRTKPAARVHQSRLRQYAKPDAADELLGEQEALLKSEGLFEALVENSFDAVVILDRDGVVRYGSRSVERVIGYTAEELMGKDVLQYVHPDDVLKVAATWDAVAATPGQVASMEVRFLQKDGSWRVCEGVGRNLLDDPKVNGIVVNCRDITERRGAEHVLRESKERYRLLAENTTDVIVSTDMNLRPTYVSPSMERLLGYSVEESMNRTIEESLTPDSRKSAMRSLKEATEVEDVCGPYKSRMQECEFYCRDGSTVWCEVTVSFVCDSEGQPVGLVTILRDIDNRKRAQEALHRSEELFRALVENSFEAIMILNADGTLRFESASMERFLGYKTGERVGDNPFSLVHPEDATFAAEAFAQCLAEPGSIVQDEVRARHNDGSWRILEIVCNNLLDDPAVEGIVVNMRDVTDRKSAEEETLRQGALLKAINEVLHETLTCKTPEEVAARCLAVAEELTGSGFGYIAEVNERGRVDTIALSDPGWESCRMPRSDAVKALKNMEIRGIWSRVLRDEQSQIINDPGSHPDHVGTPDGHPTIGSFLGVPLKRRGKTFGLVGLANKESGYELADQRAVEDLSIAFVEALDRKRLEVALKRNEEYYRSIIENGSDLITVLDGDGMICYESPSVARILGYKPDERLGQNAFDFVHPDDAPDAATMFRALLKNPGATESMNLRYLHKDGSWRIVHGVGRNLLDHPAVGGIVANLRDITENERAEEERRRMERQLQLAGRLAAVGELAAGVAHELNNPLAAVQAYAQLLNERSDLDDTVSGDVKVIYREAQRASRITNNLLSFARHHTAEKTAVSINEIIRESLEVHAHRLHVNNVEVEAELAPDLPDTMADPHHLQQVFANLITNAEQALTATPGGGRLRIETRWENGMIRATFADNGPGIPEEHLKSVFDPFFTTKAVGEGTGLGLSICYGIVEGHGGRMSVTSRLGEGSTFVVEIPIDSEVKEA